MKPDKKGHSTLVANLSPERKEKGNGHFHSREPFLQFTRDEVEQSIPDRFEKIVRLYPERIAVQTGDQEVTYAELNAMANRVAHAIIAERGAAPEPVGMLLETGIDQMAAMLGILKAGKFFVLLDPSFPAERISAVLEDSKAGLLVVDRRTVSLAREGISRRCKLVRIDAFARSIPAQDPGIPISPHALGCIVYTSGSTGQPKGVMRNQTALLHGAMLRVHTDGISHHDRLAHITAGTANSVTNSFYVLLQGATLVTFDVKREGVARLAGWLIDEKISICLIASPVFRKLCTTLTGKERFPDLRYLRLRSDTVYGSDVELHRKHFPSTCSLATGLASSETGPLREYRIKQDTEVSGSEVPVGYALDGKQILLLGDDGEEVGFNEVGEIVVRSDYLSLGYWNGPELTAAKFRPDPNGTGQRLYFTGDLGLMLPDGCLIHKGRKDFRVKIRGYGVDLIEVEKALRSHGDIKDAVVIAKRGESGDAQIIAYYTLEHQAGVTIDELRRFLGATLADYMVPSTFVKLDALPLTSNGKVDRKALPTPGYERPELKEPYQSPRNATEQALVRIWEDLLNFRPVGVHDNFFDLGGHSLTATRLVTEIIRHFKWELPLEQLFRYPTVAAIAVAIDRRQGQNPENDNPVQLPAVSVKPVSRDCQIPLAHSQRGLWFLDQLHPSGFTYNLFAAYRIKGPLNISALKKSFNEIIRRHQILRTVFESVDGSPVQVILPSLAIEIPIVDLQGIALEADRQTEVRRLSKDEAQRPFDLARGPLVRIKLLRLAQNEYVLLRVIHHIVFDGWSSGVLLGELAQLYQAFSKGEPSPLADLPVQYPNYAFWQHQCLETGALHSQLAYWKKQLANLSVLRLPTDHPRPSINRSRGARQYYELSKELCEGLRALSRRYGVTLFTIMLAAFQTLIFRHSGQNDFVIGSVAAGRNRSEFDGLIGYFLNMVALRADLSGNPTFTEVISRAWKVCLEALSHQDIPFQKVVEALRPARDLSHDPLIQVAFPFFNTQPVSPRLSGVKVNDLEVETGIARFDLQLEMEDRGDCIGGFLDYNIDLFDADTVARMLEHFRILLEAIVTDPDRLIRDLPLLTEPERLKLLVEWNDTATECPQDKCIHQLFESQAEKTPGAVAVVFGDRQINYRELNSRANQLAHHLRGYGIKPEVPVGICLERSLEMVVAILGVLKAGGVYVPLDPSYPGERLSFMLEDTQAPVLLTQQRLVGSLPKQRAHVVCLDTGWEAIAGESEENPTCEARADNLAYLIYTSGSTGRPKGVAIEHRSTAALLHWAKEVFSPEDLAGVLASTSICFDLSVFELLVPLSWGGKVIVAENALQLPTLSAANEVTLINTVPSAISELLKVDGVPASVRTVNLAGEPLAASIVEQLYRQGTIRRVYDLYGPSEDTTYSTAALRSSQGPVTIGRPIANTQIYILDSYLNPVPIGVAGELYIGGKGLARGYLNRAELTAESFVPNPFSKRPGARLYKTGDLARYRSDGEIEFLGRGDHQVKIRGFRVELGEIEAVLVQHAAVEQAVVVAREDSPGDKRSVAYVVLKQGEPAKVSELRDFVKKKLPEYMVPSAFVALGSLPLTPNGKVDRKALSALDQTRPELEKTFVPPQDTLERQLAKIWEKILGIRPIGVRDNFFDLGGHSLLAVRLLAQIEKTTGKHLPLASLFPIATVREQAKLLRQEEWTAHWRSLVAIQPGGSKLPFFCVHAHDGNVLFWRELAGHLGSDQPFYGLQAQGLDGEQAPYTRIEDMAAHYVKEMRIRQPEGPYCVGGHCFGGLVAFEMAQQLHAQGQRVALLALFDAFGPRDKKLPPNRLSLRHRVYRFIQLVTFHISNLSLLGPGERLAYIEVKFNKLLYKIYMSIGVPWVRAARARREILVAGTQALRNYHAKDYHGPITLFRATKLRAGSSDDPQMRWGRLAIGGLETHFVPGYFANTIYEPRVRVLAEKLKVCLDKAQAAESDKEREARRSAS